MRFPRAFRRAGRGTVALLFLAMSCMAAAAPAPAASRAVQNFEGTLQVQIEDHSGQRSLTRYYLLQGARRLELRNPRGALGLPSGSKVRVRGTQTGDVLALDSSGTSNLVLTTSTAELNYSIGVQNVAVLMVNFSDDTSRPVTAASLQATIFGTSNDFIQENSGGRTWLSGSIHGWLTLPMSRTVCDSTQLANLADQAAAAAGIDLSGYSRKFYVFPTNACFYSGLSIVGGANTRAWFNGNFSQRTFTHETGHSLGLSHSHALNCDTGPIGANCVGMDYGDVADTMGGSEGHYNGFQKERLGWMDDLVTVGASGRYILKPYALGTGTRVLKIPRGVDENGNPAWYFLEYRQPQGFDASLASIANLLQGVTVRQGSTGDGSSSFLLDTTPNSLAGSEDVYDPALLPGRSFIDSVAGVSVTVVSADASGAVVDIALGGGPVCTRNTPAISLSAPASAPAGGTSNVTVTVSNRDSSACAATSFNLGSALPSGWIGSYQSSSLAISAGASATATFSLTSAGSAAPGSYAFTINASCSRGAACAGSANGSQTVLASNLVGTVASSKPSYNRGETVGLGAQFLNNGVPVSGASVSFTITRPNGSTVKISATTGSNGTASASYRLNKQKDPAGSYGLRAQAGWAGQTTSASSSFLVK